MNKKILALCLAVLMIASAVAIYAIADKVPAISEHAVDMALDADNRDEQGLLYTLNDNEMTAIVGKGVYAESNSSGNAKTDIVIPDTVSKEGKPYSVREIGRNAFDGSAVKNVTIMNNTSRIGEMAFANCADLESVTMGTAVSEIAGFAFWHCPKLVDVSLGQNVASIGGAAFWSCASLEVITLPKTVSTVMEQAFKDCANLKVVYAAETAVIAENAFEGIETKPEIKNEYTPALYIPQVYVCDEMADGENNTVRIMIEGCDASADLSTLTVNGEAVTPAVEIGTAVYNGTIYTKTASKDSSGAREMASLNGSEAEMVVAACAHENIVDVVTDAGDCEHVASGDKVCATCHRVCGQFTAEGEAAHDYVDFVIEAVCLDGGYTTHRCVRCGDVVKDTFTEATGHNLDKGTVRSMPTHSSVGMKRFVCQNCKRVDDKDIPIIGDANGDGKRNAKDVTTILKYMVNRLGEDDIFWAESANCDGTLSDEGKIKINAKDITALLRALASSDYILQSTAVPNAD